MPADRQLRTGDYDLQDWDVRPAGDGALLVETGRPEEIVAAIAEFRPDFLTDYVPASRTVLLVLRRPSDAPAALEWLSSVRDSPSPVRTLARSTAVVAIDVVYDGPDLADVAARTGLREADIVALHSSVEYVAAFTGFAPGFAYLEGLPPALHLPRRDAPRTAVPAGSVAIAGEYCGVYPTASPGGWHLLGRTDAPLWSLDRTPPALLSPGTRVRFRPANRRSDA